MDSSFSFSSSSSSCSVKGYKAFGAGWRCKGYPYDLNNVNVHYGGELQLYKEGFHFCLQPIHIFSGQYVHPNDEFIKYAYVEALGDIKYDNNGTCAVTSKLRIIHEIPKDKFLDLCTGAFPITISQSSHCSVTRIYVRGIPLTTPPNPRLPVWSGNNNNNNNNNNNDSTLMNSLQYNSGDCCSGLQNSNDNNDNDNDNQDCWIDCGLTRVYFDPNDPITIHREKNDEPAVILADKSMYWMRKGRFDRGENSSSLPCVILSDGTQMFFSKGYLHRDNDEPAIILPNGTLIYYKLNRLYRDGGKPSIIFSDKSVVYTNEYGQIVSI